MHCSGCNMPIDEGSAFCGYCGKQLPPLQLRPTVQQFPIPAPAPIEPQAGYGQPGGAWRQDGAGAVQVRRSPSQTAANFSFMPRANAKTPVPIENRPTPVPPPFAFPKRGTLSSRLPRLVSGTSRNIIFLGIILMIMLLGVLAGALTLLQHKPIPSRYTESPAPNGARGSVSFSDSAGQPGMTSAITISASGLQALPVGSHYAAWMIDEETEYIYPLGTLVPHAAGFTLNVQRHDGSMLAVGNKLEITQETAQTKLPTGHVALSAHLPAMALMHIRHLLVSFPGTPGNIGLLTGLRGQTQQLYDQGQLFKTVHSELGVRCVAQNAINLIEGKHGVHAQPLDADCATNAIMKVDDGYGLLGSNHNGYIAGAAMHASLAATQRDASDTIRTHARQVIDATDNLDTWLKTIDQDAQSLLDNPADTNKSQEMIALSEQALNGVDLDHDGHVDPVKGEAGANTAYLAGQAMAQLTLLPSA